jgi:H+/Cl- antiporter ClcA
MLAASVAAGVTATFGAPIGGVLFSIEVTSTYYMVSNLWKAFFCSVWGILAYKFFSILGTVELFEPTQLDEVKTDVQYVFYIVLGALCGILGSGFISVLSKMIYLRAKMKLPFISNRWKLCTSVALIVGLCTYPIDFLKTGDKVTINEMFSKDPLTSNDRAHWN